MSRSASARRPAARRASPARRLAHAVIRRVHDDDAFADRAFRAEAARAALDARDRAFAERLALGTIQRRRTLDHVLAAGSKRPLDEVDPPLLDVLRQAAYELLFLDGVPDRAAVAEGVELAREAAGQGAAGFANAVLRRAARDGRGLLAAVGDDTPEGAAILYSYPDWLARMWWDELGAAGARELLAAGNEPPELALRVQADRIGRDEVLARLAAEGAAARAAPELPDAIVVEGAFDLVRSPLFRAGLVSAQSRGSQLAGATVGARPGERVLDLCAAPGSKSTQLAAALAGEGALTAVEHHPGRAAALRENLDRVGARWAEVRTADARDPGLGGDHDRVLLDPPCTDLGTLAARPDARWRKRAEQVDELALLQRQLLAAAADRVRPGGVLVYSTCTISPRENREVVRALLEARPDFAADPLGEQRPALAERTDVRFLQTLPDRDRTSGFFIARLRRLSGSAG